MEKYVYFIGIDVSKATLDYCLRNAGGKLQLRQFPNTVEGVKEAVKWLRTFEGLRAKESLVCMEHTGIYCQFALQVLHDKGFAVWREVAACIKNGSGSIQRGKNDKVDAGRIADYAHLFRANARLWEPPRQVLTLLADLMATRRRLMEVVNKLRVPANEIRRFKGKGHYEAIRAASSRTLASAAKELKAVERKILEAIDSDGDLKRLYRIVTSVPGVGFVTGTSLILATNEFKDISDARKLACHAGCAPFEHKSGSSVRGRAKVSKQADKGLKSLLHLGATSILRFPGEMRDYFDRKVASGKNKFVVINAVRNKIIHRVCACVRDGREYERFPAQA